MEDIFERVTLGIEGVKYVVESESSNDARESLLSKFKRVIKVNLENMLIGNKRDGDNYCNKRDGLHITHKNNPHREGCFLFNIIYVGLHNIIF